MTRRGVPREAPTSPVLDAVANLLESFQRTKRAAGRMSGGNGNVGRGGNSGSDFLQDFVELNVQYLNQMARLSSNYSIVAARALEKLYNYAVPPEAPSGPEPLLLRGVTGERVVIRIPVHNTLANLCKVEVSCGEFRTDDDQPPLDLRQEFQHPKRSRARKASFSLESDEDVEVRIGVKLDEKLVLNAEYRGLISVVRIEQLPDRGESRKRERRMRTEHVVILKREPR
jgi:hypothetical protein